MGKTTQILLIAALIVLILPAAACSSEDEQAVLAATYSAETITAFGVKQTAEAFIYTNQTMTAEAAPKTPTASETPPAISTSTPAGLPTLIMNLTPQQSAGKSGDGATFMTETVPDGTQFKPGEAFVKTWTLKNSGSTTWTTDYSIVFMRGNALGSQPSQKLPAAVPPGQSVTIALNLKAPETAGVVEGFWKLRNDKGQAFGVGMGGLEFSAKIEVKTGPTVTSGVAVTPTVTPTGPTATPGATGTITPTAAQSATSTTAATGLSGITASVTNVTSTSEITCNQPSVTILIDATITAQGSGSLEYIIFDGNPAVELASGVETFSTSGSKTINKTLTVYAAADGTYSYAIGIQVKSPESVTSNIFNVRINCIP